MLEDSLYLLDGLWRGRTGDSEPAELEKRHEGVPNQRSHHRLHPRGVASRMPRRRARRSRPAVACAVGETVISLTPPFHPC